MAKSKLLADSNILVYAINSSSPKHHRAQEFLQEHLGQLVLAHQNILETLRILTHKKFSNPMTISGALRALKSIAEECQIITPNTAAYYLTLEILHNYGLTGDKLFDAYLAATAICNDIRVIATDNIKDFQFIEEVRILNPFE